MTKSSKPKASTSGRKQTQKPSDVEPLSLDQRLLSDSRRFLASLDSIKEMYELVVPILHKKDETYSKKVGDIADYFGELLKRSKEKGGARTLIEEPKLVEEAKDLGRIANRLGRASTLFKQHAIVMFVSSYDEFMGKLLGAVLRAHPDRFKTPDKSLSYEEILQLQSLEQAVDTFVNKEVDQLLRGSHIDQILYLEKQLKLNLRDQLAYWKDFVELTERRNLFVHTGGFVSPQYIRVCKEQGVVLEKGATEGKHIAAGEEYMIHAYECLTEIGFKLGQSIHRKLWPDKLENADKALIDDGFDALQAKKWSSAKMIFGFGLSLPNKLVSNDEARRTFLIDQCIALRWNGEKQAMTELLDSVDWSAAAPKFLLAVHVLREDYRRAEAIMSTMNKTAPLREEAYRTWPLFRDFRKTDYFRRAFKKIYGRDFRVKIGEITDTALRQNSPEVEPDSSRPSVPSPIN